MTDDTTTMTDAERGQVNASAADVYEAFFVPALFGQFVEPVLDHAGIGTGDRVLDVGCGTGIVARAAQRRVGASGEVIGLDPNEGMLAAARRSGSSLDWRRGIAEALPFADASFDHTLSQFAAMFFTDQATALAEMARVTTHDGTITIATWCGLDRTPGYEAMVALIEDELGQAAADALRAPFVLGDHNLVRDLLAPIGGDLQIDEIAGVARFPSIAAWVSTDVRGWTLADLVDDAAEARLVDRAEGELSDFIATDGTVAFAAPAIVATIHAGR